MKETLAAVLVAGIVWLLLGSLVFFINLCASYSFGFFGLSFWKSMVATLGAAGLWLLWRLVRED